MDIAIEFTMEGKAPKRNVKKLCGGERINKLTRLEEGTFSFLILFN